MKCIAGSAALLLLLACTPVGASDANVVRSTSKGPIEKILGLLEGLKTNIEEDEKKEQNMYDMYACWCEKTTKRKADSIEKARSDLRSLGQQILTLKGKIATLIAEIEEITKKIKDNEEAQEEATALRQKENEAYQAESADLMQAIGATDQAVTVLKNAFEGGSLLQASNAVALGQHLKDVIAKAPVDSTAKMTPKNLLQLRQLSQDLAKGKTTYQPQSASIQGILKEMYNTFTSDLESMVEDEAKKNKDFEDFIATKIQELIDLQKDLKKKSKQKVEAEVMLAEATQAYDDTEEQMEADIEFFDETKKACTQASEDWSDRKKIRAEELAGVKKALEILSSDEARDTLGKAMDNTAAPSPAAAASSFLQVSSVSAAAKAQQKAFDILKSHAEPMQSLRLARLASQVKLAKAGHFDKVLDSIDTMIDDIKKDFAEDVEKYDECKDEYQKIKSDLADLKWKIEKHEKKIDKINSDIKAKQKEQKQAEDDLKDVRADMKEMKKVRKAENSAFKNAKKDDEDAIKLLGKAKDALSEYYDKHAKLLQMAGAAPSPSSYNEDPFYDPDVPPEFKLQSKAKNKNRAQGVVGMIELVMEDLENDITNSIKAEEQAQLSFEKNLKAAKDLEEKLDKKIGNLKGDISDLKDDRKDEKKDLKDDKKDRKDTRDHAKDIKPDCDWIIDNVASRNRKRTAEIDGLNKAKEYLVGYKEGALGKEVQKNQDDNSLLQKSLRTPKKA